MKTNTKVLLGIISGVVVGFISGLYMPAPNEGSGKGDISKVKKYQKDVVSPGMSAFQEKIMNDSAELEKVAASLAVLSSRMDEFDRLVDIAVESSDNIEELSASVTKLKVVRKLAANARYASEQAVAEFDNMIGGGKNANGYEQASQNLSLAYLMVNRQINVGKEYVSDVDEYMKDKNVEDNTALALSRDLWVVYCSGEAVLDGDSEAVAYWKDKGVLVSPDIMANITNESLSSIFDNSNESLLKNVQESLSYCKQISNVFAESDAKDVFNMNVVESVSNAAIVDLKAKEQIFKNIDTDIIGAYNETLSNVSSLKAVERTVEGTVEQSLNNATTTLANEAKDMVSNFTSEMISNIMTSDIFNLVHHPL